MKRILTTSALCLAIGLTAACGGSDDTTSAAKTGSTDQQAAGRSPGGSGEVVEVKGSTAQVKGSDSQVAVTWTDSTTFTQQISGSADDVKVGSCVMVTPAEDSSSSTDAVAAGSVRITEATDDGCSMGGGMGGGMGGPQGGGMPPEGKAPNGERPEGKAPNGERPDKAGGPRGGFAAGEVTAVTGSGFTVKSQRPGGEDATAVEVTTSGDTTYAKTAKASSDDVKVGVCVTSRGESDDTGAITATSISIADQVDGECSMGGFRGGAGGGRPDGAPDAGDTV